MKSKAWKRHDTRRVYIVEDPHVRVGNRMYAPIGETRAIAPRNPWVSIEHNGGQSLIVKRAMNDGHGDIVEIWHDVGPARDAVKEGDVQ